MGMHGPFQVAGVLGGAVIGGFLGYHIGVETIEYANTLIGYVDVLSHLVREHPYITKTVTTFGTLSLIGGIGSLSGSLGDLVMGTSRSERDILLDIEKRLKR